MATKLTRRQLGLAGLAAAAASPAPAAYTGALDGAEGKVDPDNFDPLIWARGLYDKAPLQMTFKASNRKQAEAWQKQLRAKVTELIGGFPPRRSDLAPQTLEVRDFPTYRREKVVFQSAPGAYVLAYMLTPKQGKAPHPTMICLPGHGRGVDDIVGIDDKGNDRTDKDGYQHDFALQCVEHGMAAVAIEQMAFGCRREPKAKARRLGESSCQPLAGAALLLGETMVAWRTYDVMRTVDWIETRSELDAKRVGCMGISGGGTITTFASALEPRIKAALVSGYLNTFRDSIFSLAHCIDNYVPGILNWCEMYDVASLIAPRPLFVESGERDTIFPIEASKASFARIKKVYEVMGKPELAQQETFPDEHSFWGKGGLPFLAKHL
ncbi:MAG: acetylxylan esterase [Bryobacterales bacterium]|nr:acetylxylan esterase [Acidobacteriota bacterium]MCB9385129.1 acetylxylan esterase [Bryobacterales bacterium]